MKKILSVLLIAALILSFAACKGKDNEKDKKGSSKEKTEYVTDEKGKEVTNDNGEKIPVPSKDKDTKKEPASVDSVEKDPEETKESDINDDITIPDGTVIEPNPDPEVEDPDDEYYDGYVIYEDEEGNTHTETYIEPEKEILDEGGTEENLWSDKIPSDVPKFTNYKEMDPLTYQAYDEYDYWSTGFTCTEEDYDAYLNLLSENGFKESNDIDAVWGNGNIYVDVWDDSLDGQFWFSLEVYKYKDLGIPSEFFAFETDYSIYEAFTADDCIEVYYECGTDFTSDADAYLETLAANGFTVDGTRATKKVNGKNYTCVVDYDEDSIVYYF
ncbi:MAG: hypothetical protein E7652_04165 [Ruminococcaceae bacterium]|nr:hypothetical protein [Oscillospiraceae bacterium]